MNVQVRASAFTDLLMLIFGMAMAIAATTYSPVARAIPLGLGVLLFAISAVLLVYDLAPARLRVRLRLLEQGGMLDEAEVVPAAATPAEPVATGAGPGAQAGPWFVPRLMTWLMAFAAVLYLGGYLVAVPAFLLVFLKIESRRSWPYTLAVAAAVTLLHYLVLGVILKSDL